MSVIKKIELEMYFDDNFEPPEKFDQPTREKHYDSKCELCPFYGWDDETADAWCDVTAVRNTDEECPIKKFFEYMSAPVEDDVKASQARWVYDRESGKRYCSACNEPPITSVWTDEEGVGCVLPHLTSHCPHCGAKMDK